MSDKSLCLVIGMDSFNGLPGWHRWRELIEHAHIIVASRPGQPEPVGSAREFFDARVVADPRRLKSRVAGCIFHAEVTALAISASDIRCRLNSGLSIRYLVPEGVWQDLQMNRPEVP